MQAGEAVQEDVDTVVTIIGERDIWELTDVPLEPALLRSLGADPDDTGGYRAGAGCDACNNTGFRGRLGIFELLLLSEQVKEAVVAHKTVNEIRRISIESAGLVTLLEDGIAKAAHGKVSLPDVLKRLPTQPASRIQELLPHRWHSGSAAT